MNVSVVEGTVAKPSKIKRKKQTSRRQYSGTCISINNNNISINNNNISINNNNIYINSVGLGLHHVFEIVEVVVTCNIAWLKPNYQAEVTRVDEFHD